MATNFPLQHFSIAIMPRTIREGRLELPEDFVTEYDDSDLSDAAELNLPDGRVWRIGLTREYGGHQDDDHDDDDDYGIWLDAGFRNFLRHYSVSVRDILVFEYLGICSFHVGIFDLTGFEIAYPISPAAQDNVFAQPEPEPEPEQQHSVDLDSDFDSDSDSYSDEEDSSCDPNVRAGNLRNAYAKGKRAVAEKTRGKASSSRQKIPRVGASGLKAYAKGKRAAATDASTSRQQLPKARTGTASVTTGTGEAAIWRRLRDSPIITLRNFHYTFSRMPPERKRAVLRAIESNPRSPSFLICIQKSQLAAAALHLSAEFERRYLWRDLQEMRVKVFEGESERMVGERVLKLRPRANMTMRLLSGWTSFCSDYGLVEGDVCLFELINEETYLFTLRKF